MESFVQIQITKILKIRCKSEKYDLKAIKENYYTLRIFFMDSLHIKI